MPPETRLAFGAAATATLRFRRDAGDSTARSSQLIFGVAYTQNRQLLVYRPFQLFYAYNRYYAYGEAITHTVTTIRAWCTSASPTTPRQSGYWTPMGNPCPVPTGRRAGKSRQWK